MGLQTLPTWHFEFHKDNTKWEINNDDVLRFFLKNIGMWNLKSGMWKNIGMWNLWIGKKEIGAIDINCIHKLNIHGIYNPCLPKVVQGLICVYILIAYSDNIS